MSDIHCRIAGWLGEELETGWGSRHIGGTVRLGGDEFEVTTEDDETDDCRLVLIHVETGAKYAIEVDVMVEPYHGAVTA